MASFVWQDQDGPRYSAHVDTTELEEDDLVDIIDEIGELSGRYENIATCLRVKANAVDRIKGEQLNSDAALQEVVREWLKKNYNVKRFGPPSWKTLVEAVAKPTGGNDRALAEKIAKRHQINSSLSQTDGGSSPLTFTRSTLQSQTPFNLDSQPPPSNVAHCPPTASEATPQPRAPSSHPRSLASKQDIKPSRSDALQLNADTPSIEEDGSGFEKIMFECIQPAKKGQSSEVKFTFKKDKKLAFEMIAPITDKKPLKNDDVGAYDMKCWPHGKAVIINNMSFEKKRFHKELRTREGTEIDEENLISVFLYLGYVVEVHRERSSKEIHKIMEKVSKEDHSRFDSFVCCILSHGKAGYVYGTDREKVSLEEITDQFKADKCPSLKNKPKLFFLQACRGKKKDHGAVADGDEEEMKIPTTLDFYIGYATALDYVAWRDADKGSWFISELCKSLARYARYLSLHQIMTITIRKVSSGHSHEELDVESSGNLIDMEYVQSPEVVTRLKKDVFFF